MSRATTLRPDGELDLLTVAGLRESWYSVADTAAAEVIEVDLAGVTFADAAFLGLLVGLRNRQLRHGGTVRLRAVPPRLLRLLHLTGLLPMFALGGPEAVPRGAGAVLDLRPAGGTAGVAPAVPGRADS